MAEMIACPACGIDTAMPPSGGGWRCPRCGHIWVPGTEPKDADLEQTVHEPRGARPEDD